MADSAPHSSWITNALLGVIIALVLAIGGYARDSAVKQHQALQETALQGARIEAQLAAADQWRVEHETRQHSHTATELSSLEARVAVLEMAVQQLKSER